MNIFLLLVYLFLQQRPVTNPKEVKSWIGSTIYNICSAILFIAACTSSLVTGFGLLGALVIMIWAIVMGKDYTNDLKDHLDKKD